MKDANGKPLPPPRDVSEARNRLFWASADRTHRDLGGAVDDLIAVVRAEATRYVPAGIQAEMPT